MNNIDKQFMEETADMDSNAVDFALEQFFNNVLECIDFEECELSLLNCIR